MKLISINLIGEGEELADIMQQRRPISLHSSTDDSSGSFLELKNILQKSLPGSTPSGPAVKSPVQENPAYLQALRYAAPDLGNDDYYPEKTTNPIVGSATNKTLGTFPLFSSAALAPAGLWDKRAKAAADYMLQLESAKSKALTGDFPKFEYIQGNPDWSGVYNRRALDELSSLAEQASAEGVSLAGAVDFRNPLYKYVSQITNKQKQGIETTKAIGEKVAKIKDLNLSQNTRIGAEALSATNMWEELSRIPENTPITYKGVPYNGKYDLVNSQQFQDDLYQINNSLDVASNLFPLVKERMSTLQTKMQQEYDKVGGNMDYDSYVIKRLESQYPLVGKTNPITGEPEMSSSTYIHNLALGIAKQKPDLFQDAELGELKKGRYDNDGSPIVDETGYQASAPYKISDVEDMIRDSLGYSYSEDIKTIGKPSGASLGVDEKKVKAVPQYVELVADSIVRKRNYSTKTAKGEMIPGESAATFIINGKTRIVPYDNTNEMMRAIVEMGGSDNEYGDVDAASAWANIQSDNDSYQMLSGKTGRKRPKLPPSTASFQEKFNMSAREISGMNGFPVSQGIYATSIKSLANTKDDSKFYIVAKINGDAAVSSGVVIPKDVLKAEVGDGSGIFGFGTKEAFIPKNGEGDFLTGAYYVKNPSKDGKPSTYTVYDKETNNPYEFTGKDNKSFKITVPEYFVKKITSQPYRELEKSLQSYPESESKSGASEVETNIKPNVATAKGGSGSVLVTPKQGTQQQQPTSLNLKNESDDDLKVAALLLSKKGSGATDMSTALQLAKGYRAATDAQTKDFYAKMKQMASGNDAEKIRQQYSTGNKSSSQQGASTEIKVWNASKTTDPMKPVYDKKSFSTSVIEDIKANAFASEKSGDNYDRYYHYAMSKHNLNKQDAAAIADYILTK